MGAAVRSGRRWSDFCVLEESSLTIASRKATDAMVDERTQPRCSSEKGTLLPMSFASICLAS